MFGEQSVVKRDGERLVAVPYHIEFAEFLNAAAQDLREAAKLSDDPQFVKFLNMRADALLSDDYYASDLAWLDSRGRDGPGGDFDLLRRGAGAPWPYSHLP